MLKKILKHVQRFRGSYLALIFTVAMVAGFASYVLCSNLYNKSCSWLTASVLESGHKAPTYNRGQFVIDVVGRLKKASCFKAMCADMKGGMPEEKARCELEKRGVYDGTVDYKWYQEALNRAEALKVVVKAFDIPLSSEDLAPNSTGSGGTGPSAGGGSGAGMASHGSRISVTDEPAGKNCPNGGKRIDSGDELGPYDVPSTSYACTLKSPKRPICGNGIMESYFDIYEECDDGNTKSGDGCSSVCDIESGWTCTGQPSSCSGVCGDDKIESGEACDDGNRIGGDGCSPICLLENPQGSVCGNGKIEPGETCDDGPANGWANYCNKDCSGATTPICGNGIKEKVEECDDKSGACCPDCKWQDPNDVPCNYNPLKNQTTKQPFKDVKADAWYAPYVQAAFNGNLIKKGSGKFGPERLVNKIWINPILKRTKLDQLCEITPSI